MHNEVSPQNGNSEVVKGAESDFDFSAFLMKSNKLPHGEPMTYGATPLDRMTTLQQQFELSRTLQELTYRDIPDDVPMEIIDYVHTTFATRFNNRAEANEENYVTSLNVGEEYESDIQAMFKRGELGQASPSELLLIRQLRGIRSVELACLTHPYGKRLESLPDMREAVHQHVELLGGTYYDDPETRYRVKEIVGYEKGKEKLDKGVLMTRKRTLGVMPDGTVIRERLSYVLRLDDKTTFTQDDAEALNGIDLSKSNWQEELMRVGKFDEVAATLLLMDEFSFVIPISTTIYAFNSETACLIEKRDAKMLARRRALFAKQNPVLSAAMKMVSSGHKVAEDKNGLYYVGPDELSKDPFDLFDSQDS